jgi:AraC-like DNA-binding protein
VRIAAVPKVSALDSELPLWPPLLATRGQGTRSTAHAHHAIHIVLALEGDLSVRIGNSRQARRGAGVVTAPDVPHALDADGVEILLVFLDPESEVGASLRPLLVGSVRVLSADERDRIAGKAREHCDPMAIMQRGGAAWTQRAVDALGGAPVAALRAMHPRVKKVLKLLRAATSDSDTSLEALAAAVGLSPGRLMHAFSESIGVPLRPYLAWLKLQRAAAAIVSGAPLGHAAHAAGFADSAHMTRTFRRMFGMSPSALKPRS